MKKLKKALVAIALVVMICTLVGCNNNDSTIENSEKIKIVASSFPQCDLVRAIAGESAEIKMLLPAGSEVHAYEPSVKDIMNVSECDLFVYNGGASDEWVRSVIKSSENEDMVKFSFMENCSLLHEEILEGMQHEHEHEHEEEVYDEHVWTSPINLLEIAQKLCDELCKLDEKNANIYIANKDAYSNELSLLDQKIKDLVGNAKRKTLVFADRFPFYYFAKEYELECFAAFPGCASNTQASAATLAFLTDKVKNENIPCVFTIEFSDGKIADAICFESTAKKLLLHSCHNITKEQFDNDETYITLMDRNLDALREALY